MGDSPIPETFVHVLSSHYTDRFWQAGKNIGKTCSLERLPAVPSGGSLPDQKSPGSRNRVVEAGANFRFAEHRRPTLEEIIAVVPNTPVFTLHLFYHAILNRGALQMLGY